MQSDAVVACISLCTFGNIPEILVGFGAISYRGKILARNETHLIGSFPPLVSQDFVILTFECPEFEKEKNGKNFRQDKISCRSMHCTKKSIGSLSRQGYTNMEM